MFDITSAFHTVSLIEKGEHNISLSYLFTTYFLIGKTLPEVELSLKILFCVVFKPTEFERTQLRLKQKLQGLYVSNVKSLPKEAFTNNHFVTLILKHGRYCLST